jgi:transcriptional regulator with XRE-family HTH domain
MESRNPPVQQGVYSHAVESDFAAFLRDRIRARGLSLRATAARAGMDPAYLSRVVTRVKRLPADRIGPLADALDLHHGDRTEFVRRAHLSLASPALRALIHELEQEIARMRRRLAEIDERG